MRVEQSPLRAARRGEGFQTSRRFKLFAVPCHISRVLFAASVSLDGEVVVEHSDAANAVALLGPVIRNSNHPYIRIKAFHTVLYHNQDAAQFLFG